MLAERSIVRQADRHEMQEMFLRPESVYFFPRVGARTLQLSVQLAGLIFPISHVAFPGYMNTCDREDLSVPSPTL